MVDAPKPAEASDGDFDIVSRDSGRSMKIKDGVDASLVKAVEEANVAVTEAHARTPKPIQSATATAITVTPFILGGLAGLAIYKIAGRRMPKVPTTVCFFPPALDHEQA